MTPVDSAVDELVSVVACREALVAVAKATACDRASAITGLVGALIVMASTSPAPTDTLTGIIESLETARPLLGSIGARVTAAVATPGGQPS